MDKRRLSTSDLLAMGITSKPLPESDVPKDRESFDASGARGNYLGDAAVIEALEANKIAECSGYYGVPVVWKHADEDYRGALFQYRAVTESKTFTTASDAAAWLSAMFAMTDG